MPHQDQDRPDEIATTRPELDRRPWTERFGDELLAAARRQRRGSAAPDRS